MERELNGNLEPDRSRIVSGLDLWSAKRALARHRIASWRTVRALNVALALIAVLAATDARARALSLFRYEDQAQRHCPADTVVWLDFKKHKYYSRGQKLYASGSHGSFVCLQEARRSLYRRSLLGLR
jgi:hypothetical protein